MSDDSRRPWLTRSNAAFAVFLAVAGYFLWTEHRAHVIEYLPYVLILACIGMHLFMHGGHGHGGHGHGSDARDGTRDDANEDDAGSRGDGTR